MAKVSVFDLEPGDVLVDYPESGARYWPVLENLGQEPAPSLLVLVKVQDPRSGEAVVVPFGPKSDPEALVGDRAAREVAWLNYQADQSLDNLVAYQEAERAYQEGPDGAASRCGMSFESWMSS